MKNVLTKEVKIGLWVIVALAILFFGINYLKGINIFHAANYYYASYTNVEGLATSAPVTLNGFKVGQVREINYDFKNPGHVIVEMSVDKNLRIPAGTKAVLGSSLLGTASIILELSDTKDYHNIGDHLIGEVQPGMLDALSNQFMPSISQIFPKVDTLLTTINALASNPALQTSISRLDAITADLATTTSQVARISQQLASVPGQINPILADVKNITGNVSTISSDVSVLSGKMREMPFDELVANLKTTTENLRVLTQQLNDPNSSLGQLMHDPALYNNLNNTVVSLDSLFVDIKKNPKRYVQIKVF